MATVRPAAVAGAFYPAEPRVLAADIGDLLDGAGDLLPKFGFPKALVVPHAGYIYSGPVAAHAYDTLTNARGVVRRVVLLGPVHRVPVRGLALPGVDRFATPLGMISVDADAVRALEDLPQVVTSTKAHAMEHSLEVQLPFLQRMLGEFSLVPFAVGAASPEQVAEVIERLWGGRETLVIISTDMSHFHAYDEARRADGATLERIAAFATDIDHQQACGATPLNGMLRVAQAKRMSIRLLSACNSGDTAGGKDRVVGYSAFALEEGEAVSRDEAGRTLIAIARAAIAHALGLQAAPPATDAPDWLAQAGATFITLTRHGALRGCIGSLQAARTLGADVAANAVSAAMRDPRFTPLTAAEWADTEVEVSLLSAAKPIRFGDEAELLAAIEPGVDGLIIECDGRRGTFLPQVWESIPDKHRFLAELKRKAGLAADTHLARCRLWRYRAAKWKQKDLH